MTRIGIRLAMLAVLGSAVASGCGSTAESPEREVSACKTLAALTAQQSAIDKRMVALATPRPGVSELSRVSQVQNLRIERANLQSQLIEEAALCQHS